MGTDLALAFDKRFYEIDEVFFVSVSKLNHHPNINQVYDYFLFIFSKKLSYTYLLLSALGVHFFHLLRIESQRF